MRRPMPRNLFDREPPHDAEAEAALIGALLIDPSVSHEVAEYVPNGNSFYLAAHAIAYDAILGLIRDGGKCDAVMLKAKLDGRDELDGVGGVSYLARIVEETPSAVGALGYAKIVHNCHRARKTIAAAEDTLHKCYTLDHTDEHEVGAVLGHVELNTLEATAPPTNITVTTIGDLLPHVEAKLQDSSSLSGVTSGFVDYDDLTGGFGPGEVTIIGARPAMGKTMLALEIAYRASLCGHSCFVASAEMGDVSIAERLLCRVAQLPAMELRKRGTRPGEARRMHTASRALSGLRIAFDDTPGIQVDQLRQRVRRQVEARGVELVVIDYLQLLGASMYDRQGTYSKVGHISRTIKQTARENNIAVVCLAQLNRNVEGRDTKRPGAADLRDSGNIEQDADVVALLHREEAYHIGDQAWAMEHPDEVGKAELIVAKQRNGPTGVVELKWDAGRMAFADWPQRYGSTYGI